MKLLVKSFIVATALMFAMFCASVSISGCKTSQQQVVFNTLYSVEHGTVAAYDAYVGEILAGTVSTNGLPRVSKSFNTFQASFLVALDADQFNTNALAPASLVVEAQDVINVIATVKKEGK